MSYPVDVEDSPEISSVGDYKTPLLSGLSRVSDRPFGDYSDASPEKEVGEIDEFYSPISQFDENVLQPINKYWLTRMTMEFRAISRRWLRTGDSPTYFGDCTQSKAEEEAHASFSWREQEIQDNGYTTMHVAASNGDLETLRTLIETNKNKCLRRDKHGGTPLHAAAKRGRVEALKVILKACPETVKKVTVRGENCLHTAVLYNQVGAVRFLVEWLKRNRDYAHLINGKDYDGKTPLHLATSRIQIQTLEALLTSNMVDVNATTCGGFTALDILSVLPRTGINVEIDTILFEAGALRARDLANRDANSYAARGYKRKWFNMNTIIPFINMVVLLVATWVTTRTYQAAFTAFGATFNDGGSALSKQESIITGLFLLFNAMAFIGSLAVAILVVHKLSAHAA